MVRGVGDQVAKLGQRTQVTLRDRVHRVRFGVWLALQTGLAAGLAWLVAHDLVGHPAPFFAPVAAVVTLAVSVGQRLRRAVELVVGVAIGIAVGDLLIAFIGTGPVQITAVVILAILSAILLGGGSALVTHAATSAVLVATLTPPGTGLSFPRFVDALVGGLVGLGVMALLLPVNPLRVVARATAPMLDLIAENLTETGAALSGRDWPRAERALSRLRAGEAELSHFQDSLAAGREAAALAPIRWRTRGALARYLDSGDQIGYALRNVRVLVRRAIRVTVDGEPVPESLPEAVILLGEAVSWLRRELAEGIEPETCRQRALAAVQESARAYEAGVGFSGSVIVAQIRSTAIDLLQASGVAQAEASDLVRRAAR
ncbi:FUSC family protein [Natronosporangium hydrolyticum]|uniref:FUSC family protein n=1 Tax=Natronosporangium hydrolyticum TaxID=2811111 RepID=A0A895YLY4_9ACTN|nr:FUSC family protein [Natronosporangium hydrolyticum]QSB16982.1 FUSC family protein [Natronosporangium hydrolyticum]